MEKQLTPEQQAEIAEIDRKIAFLKRLQKTEEARDQFLPFVELTMPDHTKPDDLLATRYETATHHKAIAQALEEVEKGNILRLIITMPPRHGKSELASRRFPPWFMGKDKSRQVIFATYSSEFAEDFGRTSRDIMLSDEYQTVFPGVMPKKDTRAAKRMEIIDGGMMVFTGVGGPVTGRGADLLIIDDPFKDRSEAESLTIRDKRWDWFTSTGYTRLMPGGRVVIIVTRWHEDDIVGRLLSTDYMQQSEINKWHRLDLPALANEGKPNEAALWPSRYPVKTLHEIRNVVGPRDWNALFQQRPTPPEGAYFKRDMIESNLYSMKELPPNLTPYTAFDLAVGTKAVNDHTCCLSAGLDADNNLWLLPEMFWDKRPADQTIQYIAAHVQFYDSITIYCEKGQLDKAVGPFLTKYFNDHQIYKFIEKLPSVANKGARATAIRGMMAQGKVKFPKEAIWWPKAFDQLLKFTGSGDDKEDDFVDALALIGQGLHQQLFSSQQVEQPKPMSEIGTFGWVKAQAMREKKMNNGGSAGW